MKKTTQLALVIGSTIAASGVLAPAAQAAQATRIDDSPFRLTALSSGYQLAEADMKQKDGKCGEAKCGADKAKAKEAACGANKMADGKCGADKTKTKEAACGANKAQEGKCGGAKK